MTVYSPICAVLATGFLLILSGTASAELTAEVKDHLGSPTLFVNGEPRTPLMFFGWDRGPGPTEVELGTEWREYHVTFTAPEDTRRGAVHLRFGNAPGTVWIDGARLYEGEYRPDAGENMLRCGDWECDRATAEDAWRLFVKTEAGAEASWTFDPEVKRSGAQSCRLTIAQPGTSTMHVHFYQTGLTFEQGTAYTFSVWLKADRERTGDMMALHHGPPWTIYSGEHDTWLHKQVQMAAAQGIHIHSFGLPTPWPKPGETADFSEVDAILGRVIAADPDALMLPRFSVHPPQWWYDQHPGEMLHFDDGSRGPVCVASDLWRADLLPHLRALVEHCETHFGEHMLGYHPCAQHTAEWFYPKTWDGRHCGFSPAMQRGFSGWLTEKYATEPALRTAWADSEVTFDSVTVPTVEERNTAAAGVFRDPALEQKTIDFLEYLQVAMVEPIELVASTIKDACGRKKLVTIFYGYYFEISGLPLGPQTSGHLALGRLLESPDIDILCSPISYLDRGLGGIGAFMLPVDSVRDRGILWLNEDDTRTFLTPEDAGYGRVGSLEHTRWVHQRNFAQLLPRRLAAWYMDLGGAGWLADERIWQNIAALRDIYEEYLDRPAVWSPEVAVIADERSPFYLACNNTVMRPLASQFRTELYRMGAPFRQYLLSDLEAGRVPEHTVYLFIGCFRLTDAQREAIARATEGKTAIWMYGSGYIKDGPATEHMAALLGMPVRKLSAGVPALVTPEPEAALSRGLSEQPFGVETPLDPLWSIEEAPGVEVLGRFGDGSPGAAAIRRGGQRTVYVGTLNAPAQLLRNVLHESGVHVYLDSDDLLLTDGAFLSVTASSEGEKTIALPSAGPVRRMLPDPAPLGHVATLTETFAEGETRFYQVQTQ